MSTPRSEGVAQAGAGARYVRVAVVQLAHVPAFKNTLSEPSEKPPHSESSLLPPGVHAAPTAVRAKLNDLRRRVRAAYVEALRQRVETILAACKGWGVDVCIFPEYAIAPEILGSIASVAGDMVVVAGSHYVDRETIKGGYYEPLDGQRHEELLEQSVCPVLHAGKLLKLVSKQHAAKPELGAIKAGEWAPVEMPEGLPGPMAVLICLDFLSRESTQHIENVAAELNSCRFIAAPALTPKHSLDEFMAKALMDARRTEQHRPVFFANDAQYGGSTIIVDEGRPTDPSLFPEHAGRLEASEEGVIIADVNLGISHPGSSTPYVLSPIIRPFAAASLVYRGIEGNYARWIAALNTLLDVFGLSDFAKLESIAALIGATPPPLPGNASARKRRLERLLQEVETESSIVRVQQWTRELVLPEEVLPLPVLRAALSRGAEQAVQSWFTREHVGDKDVAQFANVHALLKAKADAILADGRMAGWSEATRSAVRRVVDAVRGEARNEESRVVPVEQVESLLEVLEPVLKEKAKAIQKLYERGEYDKARDESATLADTVERMLAVEVDKAKKAGLASLAVHLRVHEAAISMNMGEPERVRAVLPQIRRAHLTQTDKLNLVHVLGGVGEYDEARALLGESGWEGVDPKAVERARLGLDISEGKPFGDLGDSQELHINAAYRYFGERDLEAAAKHALEALKNTGDNELCDAMAVEILVNALHNTVFEVSGISQYVPADRALREEIILALDGALVRLHHASLPKRARQHLLDAEDCFRRDCQDLDWEPLREAKEEGSEVVSEVTDHPWAAKFERMMRSRVAEEFDVALVLARELATEFPGKMPIEYDLAALLSRRGDTTEALEHAQKAFEALPGVGQRCFLAELLLRSNDEQRFQKVWDLLQPVNNERAGSRTVLLLARAAEALELGKATAYWRRYVELRPDDAHTRVHWATHLVALGKPSEAAEVAWRVFSEHAARLDLNDLQRCAQYQHISGLAESRQIERMRAILDHLRDRFRDNPEAAFVRIRIAIAAGIELRDDEAAVDYALLPRASNVRTFESVEPLVAMLKSRRERLDLVATFLHCGALPITTFCSIAGTELATFAEKVMRQRKTPKRIFCPAVRPFDDPSELSLKGASLLFGHFELLLLQELELLEDLRIALEGPGRIVLFHRTLERIANDAVWLREGRLRSDVEEHRGARERATKLHAWVGEGIQGQWIHVLPDPTPPSFLPAPRDPQNELVSKLVAEPMREALSYRMEMRKDPRLQLVTAEFYVNLFPGDPGVLVHFDWHEGQREQLRRLLAETVPRDLFVPRLVRTLVQNRRRRFLCLRTLAELGFADALGVDELSTWGADASDLLGQHESMARELPTFAGELARLRLASTYATTVFRAFGCHRKEEAPLEGREALAAMLLGRLERIDELQGAGGVEAAVRHLGILTADYWSSAWREVDGVYKLEKNSALHEMWTLVSGWIGADPGRRGAYGRAAREVWLAADEIGNGTPPQGIVDTLFLAFPANVARPDHIDLLDADTESIAILSSCWSYSPLEKQGVTIVDAKGSYDIDSEELLRYGARLLEHSEIQGLSANECWAEFGFPVETDSGKRVHLVRAPIEALLLRARKEHRKRIAEPLMRWQGPHDGQAHHLLEQIEHKPREYARWAVSALFRLVREDPAALHSWAYEPSALRRNQRTKMEELLAILSEPYQGLASAPTLLEVVHHRATEGAWAHRADGIDLVAMASEIPGPLPALMLNPRLRDEKRFSGHVESALYVLDSPDEIPSSRLAGAILFLRVALARQPFVNLAAGSIDLREVVPDRFARLLDHVTKAPKPDTLTAHEPALLQVCAGIIQHISKPAGVPVREGLWLTWRLFQWLCRQLEAIDPDARREGMRRLAACAPKSEELPEPMDRLDPFGFGRDRFDIRLAAVLHAFSTMEEVWQMFGKASPHTVSSKKLEENLLAVASRHPEKGVTSVLDWAAPGTIPDLALLALLRVKLSAFGELPKETRIRLFEGLPIQPDPASKEDAERSLAANALPHAVMHAVSIAAHTLDAEERKLLIDKLHAMQDGPTSRRWRWIAFLGLFVAGEAALEGELFSLFVEHGSDRSIEAFLGLFLLVIANTTPERLVGMVDQLVDAFIAAGKDPVPIALGLGQVQQHGTGDAPRIGKGKLAALAKRTPFCDDDRVREVVTFLDLAGEGGDG